MFSFPKVHQRRLRTVNVLERVHRELERRTRVVSIFLNQAACLRLVSAILMELDEAWQTGKMYLALTEEARRRRRSGCGKVGSVLVSTCPQPLWILKVQLALLIHPVNLQKQSCPIDGPHPRLTAEAGLPDVIRCMGSSAIPRTNPFVVPADKFVWVDAQRFQPAPHNGFFAAIC